jgi:O-antigen ligase
MAMLATNPARPVRNFTSLKPTALGIDLLVVLLGVGCSFNLHLVGEFPITEAALIILLPVLIPFGGRKLLRPGLRPIFMLMLLWLVAQIVTDIYRGSASVDWMRGDANIVFFGVDFACVAILLGKIERRKILFATAFAIGSLLSARYQPTDIVLVDPWKFGYSTGITMLVLLVCNVFFNIRWYAVIFILLSGLAAVDLLMNFRSPVLGIMITMAMVIPVVPERIGRVRILPPVGTRLRVVVLVILVLGAGASAVGLLNYATASGLAGEEAKEKNETQSRSKGGIMLGGRPEILVSLRAAMASPIIGYGSWAKDMKYVEMLSDIRAESFIKTDLQDIEDTSKGLIPTHSHIMGAWVWAGILGAIFWAFIFWLNARAMIQVAILRPRNAPLYAWLFVGMAWDILFSPFAGTRRATESLVLIIIVDLAEAAAAALKTLRFRRQQRSRWRRLPPRWPSPRIPQLR